MSMLPLGLALNLDVTLNLNLSVGTQASYCFRNPMVKGKCQETWLILAVPPSTPQPEEFWAGQELSVVQSQEATAAKLSYPRFCSPPRSRKKNQKYYSASNLEWMKSSSPLPPNLLNEPCHLPCPVLLLLQGSGESSFDHYKKAMASLRLRFFALQWYKFSPDPELLVVLTTQFEIKLPLVLLYRNSSQIESSIHTSLKVLSYKNSYQ